ncbi:S-layer homology domain-containing protein [Paenibacillus sp. PR3]|uniref:S-layer homology domain-containing protein n=1 Tax=Paenibacillus terricola TaxID=2763503 RepID=A0ABR8N0U7_9BACL|nr:S-layer homology domain-containing protein [Paenibacillus terricola]MBD3920805.1 S-layer homology domain-containing protein [Paenibacillus terricola]
MKKSLSLLVAITMVFSMFASVAFAADKAAPTQNDKFNALKDLGIFTGFPNGDAGLDQNMTRAQFAKVLALGLNLDENAAASKYSDVSASHWAKPFIGAVTAAELMQGKGNNKFDPNGNVTIEELAKTLVLGLGLEEVEGATVTGASAWAAGYVQAALDAKIIPTFTNYKAAATRGQLVDAIYEVVGGEVVTVKSAVATDAKTVEVTFSDDKKVTKTLDTALEIGKATKVSVEYNGKTYEVEVTLEGLKVAKATQTGAKKITLEFNKAVTKDLAIEVKYLSTTVAVTKTFAENLKSVVLEAGYLPAGDLTIKAGDAEAVTVKAEAEKATKVSITTESLQKADGQDLGIKKFNQFGEETSVGQTVNKNVYNSTQGKDLVTGGFTTSVASSKVNLSTDAAAKVDDTIIVSAYTNDGLSDTKSFKVTAASSATKIELSAVQPKKDKTRITVGETGLVLPVKLTDQFGKELKLAAGTATVANGQVKLSGITFLVGGDGAVDNFTVDSNNVVTVDATKAGNVILSASNPATGAYSTTTFKVEAASALKELKLQNPVGMAVVGEDVVIPFTALDSFGGTIAGKDVDLSKVQLLTTQTVAAKYPKINAKGELVLNFTTNGTATIQAVIGGVITSTISFDVLAKAKIESVQGLKDVATTLESGASVDLAAKQIKVVDNYGRVKTIDEISALNPTFSVGVVSGDFTYANGKLTATAGKNGTGKIQITYNDADHVGAANALKSSEIVVTSVKTSDIKSYEIKSVGTVYGNKDNKLGDKYSKTIELNGKTEGGTVVALVSPAPAFVTSSDESVLAVNSAAANVSGLKAGKSTIAAYLNGNKVAETEVTVSDATPVATTVKLDKSEYSVFVLAANGSQTATVSVEVKDQYGVVITPNGFLTSKDDTVSISGLTVTAVKKGTATITYVTSNGASATATVLVE